MAERCPPGYVARGFMIPVDLDEWLTQAANEDANHRLAAPSKSRMVTQALRLLRELRDGVPSDESQLLLDDVLDRIALPPKRRKRAS